MIEYDESRKKMVLKLVYYGPAMSGKTTKLLKLHDLLCHEGRDDLMVLDTQDDRTIFFDRSSWRAAAACGPWWKTAWKKSLPSGRRTGGRGGAATGSAG